MLKNLCQLEYKNENYECRLLCNNDTPIYCIKEALFQFQKYIGTVEDAAKAQQEANKQVVDPEPVVEDNEEA